MAKSGTRIIAKNDDERMTVVLPVPKGSVWPTKNIAYFCSTGQSGVKAFDGTYFPTLGVYVDTPIPDIDKSITLSKNYFVKTSSLTFLKATSDRMPEWVFMVLRNYYESRKMVEVFELTLNEVRDIKDVAVLRQLDEMYKEIDLIYRCLSSYFTDIWQVRFSICLSDTFQSGVWLGPLKEFADYVKSLSVVRRSPRSRKAPSPKRTPRRKSSRSGSCKIADNTKVTSDDVYTFLTRNDAQCDFTTISETMPVEWYKTRTSHMHDSLFKNLQSVEMSLRIAEKFATKGGTRKNKNRK